MKSAFVRSFCVLLALVILGLAPGIEPYRAVAQVTTGEVPGSINAGAAGLGAFGTTVGMDASGAAAGLREVPSAVFPVVLGSGRVLSLGSGSAYGPAPSAVLQERGLAPRAAGSRRAADILLNPRIDAGVNPSAHLSTRHPAEFPANETDVNPLASGLRPTKLPDNGTQSGFAASALQTKREQSRILARGAWQGLIRPLPDFGAMREGLLKGGAEDDFRARTGQYSASVPGGFPAEKIPVMSAADLSDGLLRPAPPAVGAPAPISADVFPSASARGRRVPDPDRYAPFPQGTFLGDLWRLSDWRGPWARPLLLLTAVAVAGAGMAGFLPLAKLQFMGFYAVLVIPKLILHEMGHALWADWKENWTPRLAGRLSLKPRDLFKGNLHPLATIIVPLLTIWAIGFPWGLARPVPVPQENFKESTRDRDVAQTAFMGPAVNIGLALLGGLAHAAALAAGATFLLPVLELSIFFDLLLAFGNLVPLVPFDGSQVLRWLLKNVLHLPGAARWLDSHAGLQIGMLIAAGGWLSFHPAVTTAAAHYLIGMIYFVTGAIVSAAGVVVHDLMRAQFIPVAHQATPAALPVLAAFGIMQGGAWEWRIPGWLSRKKKEGAQQPRLPTEESSRTIKLLVRLKSGPGSITQDEHLDILDSQSRGYARAYAEKYGQMLSDLEAASLDRGTLSAYRADPVATYKRINMATLLVPLDQKEALSKVLEARGHEVYDDSRRDILRPIPVIPDDAKNIRSGTGGVATMEETLKRSTMDRVHREVGARWGPPPLLGADAAFGWMRRTLRRLGADIPQPPAAVLDSGAQISHKLLGTVAGVKNMTAGPNVDDSGYGSWAHSMLLRFAPWAANTTHYRTFVDGGASLDDLLKALTSAADDGNIVITSPAGYNADRPESPVSLLVRKLAEEGRIVVLPAGDADRDPSAAGSPVIVHYRDAQTGVHRALMVEASDLGKEAAGFAEGAWPDDLKSDKPDRIDPVYGPVRAIHGASVAAPEIAGTALMLAQIFGVTTVGKKFDEIAQALTAALNGPGAAGDGNIAYAAYRKALEMGLTPVVPRGLSRIVLKLLWPWAAEDS